MRVLFFFGILISTQNLLFAQSEKQWKDFNKCKRTWSYIDIKDSVTGIVLFDKTPGADCGIFSTASMTLVKTSKGDTVRVLNLCNTTASFEEGTFVIVQPQKKPGFGIDILPFDPLACIVMPTSFGIIRKR